MCYLQLPHPSAIPSAKEVAEGAVRTTVVGQASRNWNMVLTESLRDNASGNPWGIRARFDIASKGSSWLYTCCSTLMTSSQQASTGREWRISRRGFQEVFRSRIWGRCSPTWAATFARDRSKRALTVDQHDYIKTTIDRFDGNR